MRVEEFKITDKPWGFEELLTVTESYVMKKISINPGQRLSLQYHEEKEETIYIASGECYVWVSDDDDERIVLKAGDVYHVKPGEVHRFGAPDYMHSKYNDEKPCILIECSTTQLTDVVRISDDYKR